MKLKKILISLAVVGLIALGFVYLKFFASNTDFTAQEVYVKIPTGSTYEEAKKIISPYVKDMSSFELMAGLRQYDKNVKPGKFLLKNGMGSFQLVRALRQNVPVKLAFNNQERLENFVQRVSSELEPDSLALMTAFTDPAFLQKNGFNRQDVMALFIPNTYEFYWNTTAEKFRDKMLEEYKKFWNANRLAKAKALSMTPNQVVTLASIVHKESVKADERPRIAKVYLNRLEAGMPLQADPTVIYAKKLEDNDFNQVIKRVAGSMLSSGSLYNTYVHTGLPPGPIAMPDINAIDAVLNPEQHDYLYFCASIDRFGYHEFASTYAQHQLNATKYAQWLNSQGIK